MSERAGRGFDADRMADFRMARRLAVQLAEVFQVVGADVVAALLIVGLEYTAIKNYKKRKEEEEEV